MFDKSVYVSRRKELSKLMKRGIGVFVGNLPSPINYSDNCYEFSQDSNFLYFFGMNRENLVAVIDFATGESYISGHELTLDDKIWTGEVPSIAEEMKNYGIDKFVHPNKLIDFLIDKSEGTDEDDEDYFQEFCFLPTYRLDVKLELARILEMDYEDIEEYASKKLIDAVVTLRNIKTDYEIEEIEKAVNVTREMHLAAMKAIKPGMFEWEIKAIVESVALKHNCTTSFHTIATKRGEVLHNHNSSHLLGEGDVFLLDCGAKTKSGYCGDLTSVFPVNGTFSARHVEMYSILVDMFKAASEKLLPGAHFADAYSAAAKELIHHFKRLGILHGDEKEMLEKGVHALFFPHSLGHMLGMDVHDMENLGELNVGYDGDSRDSRPGYRSLRLSRVLKPGFVFTVEPGIYFIPALIADYKKKGTFKEYIDFNHLESFADLGGMRYEGDFLITDTGHRRLGHPMPMYAHEVEEIMKK